MARAKPGELDQSLSPDWDEDHVKTRAKRAKRAWRPGPFDRRVMQALGGHPRSERQLLRLLVGDGGNEKKIESSIDRLVKHGFVQDSGERGEWTAHGRSWIWALTDEGKQLVQGWAS